MLRFIISGVLFSLVLSLSAYAELNSSDKWKFQLTPYALLAGQEGKVATLPGLPPADIDVDFYSDILGNINSALMFVGEGRVDRAQQFVFSVDETADVGFESASPVSKDYSSGDNGLTGKVKWIQIDLEKDDHDHLITPNERLRVAMVRQ